MKKIITALGLFFLILNFANAEAGKKLVLQLKTGKVVIQLLPNIAPQHCKRVIKLAQEGAYDNVAFHRVIEGFMAQTGDVQYGKKDSKDFDLEKAGIGGSSYPNIPAEFNKEPFLRGAVGMARSSDPNSANSQFFICLKDSNFLNNQYTVFGKVISGMQYVDSIKKGDIAENGKVNDPDYIIKATIE